MGVTTHGYSGTPLPQKLGLKPGLVVYVDGGPDHVDELLGGAPYTSRLPRRVDVTLLFCTSRARLEKRLPLVLDRTPGNGMVWVCWPKKASRVATDLDETWSGRSGWPPASWTSRWPRSTPPGPA